MYGYSPIVVATVHAFTSATTILVLLFRENLQAVAYSAQPLCLSANTLLVCVTSITILYRIQIVYCGAIWCVRGELSI